MPRPYCGPAPEVDHGHYWPGNTCANCGIDFWDYARSEQQGNPIWCSGTLPVRRIVDGDIIITGPEA